MALSDFCAKKLLEPGWGGELDDTELAHILAALQKNNRLRTAWGFPGGERRLSEDAVRQVAMWGDPNDPAHNTSLVRQARRTANGDTEECFPAMNQNGQGVGLGFPHPMSVQPDFPL